MAHARGRRAALGLALLLTISSALAQESGTTARVVLRWKPVAQAVQYELEIARDPAFKEVVLKERMAVAGYRWGVLPRMRHYWRVRSVDAEGRLGDWSEPRSIAPAVVAPALLRPPDGATFSSGERSLELAVAPSEVIRTYLFELARDPQFTRELQRKTSSEAALRIPLPGTGTFFWRARGTDLNGQESAPSEVRAFKVVLAPALTAPPPGAVLSVRTDTADVELSWAATPGAAAYLVEMARDRAFSSLAGSHKLPGLSWRAERLAAGEYRWRVTALDAAGKPSATSEPRTLTLALIPPLSAPAPNSPLADELVPDTGSLRLAWAPVPEAARYEVALAPAGELDSAAPRTTDQTELRLAAPAQGPYSWRVRALDAQEVPGPWSPTMSFFLGVPPSASAEILPGAGVLVADGRSSTDVRIRLLDARGRLVRGAAVELTCTAGKMEAVAERDGEYVARYVAPLGAPDGGAAWILVKDRTFEASTRVQLSEPGGRLRAGVRLGWNSTFGFLSSPLFGLDLTWRLPFARSRLLASGRLGYYGTRGKLDLPDGRAPLADAQVVRGTLLGLYVHQLGMFSVYGGAGPSVQLARVTVEPLSETQGVLGFQVLAGGAMPLGPGEIPFELSYTLATLNTEMTRLQTGGLALTFGYRLALY